MSKTLEINGIDLKKKRAYTTSNGSIRLSPSFRFVLKTGQRINSNQLSENNEEIELLKQKLKKNGLTFKDLLKEGKNQRHKLHKEYYEKPKKKNNKDLFSIAGTVPAKIKITHKNWHRMRDIAGFLLGLHRLKEIE